MGQTEYRSAEARAPEQCLRQLAEFRHQVRHARLHHGAQVVGLHGFDHPL